MTTRTRAGRIAAVGLAAALTAVAATQQAAGAASGEGVSTATVTTSVLDAALGDLLGLTLLQDVAGSNNDPKVGAPGATSTFNQLKLTSALPALNRTVGEHRVSAPAGPTDVTTSLLDLGSLGLGAVVDGVLQPLTLKAAHTPSATTASSAKVTDLGLLGGLANLGVLRSTDSTGASTAAGSAGRAMSLEALSLLDLGKLLDGLGLDILDLPLTVVSGLLQSLGVPIDLKGAASLTALVNSLRGSITTLTNSLANQVSTITAPVLASLGALGLPVPLQPVLDTVTNTALTTLQNTLNNLIDLVVGLLDSATVLKVNALDITTVAKATDTVGGSSATATGTLGSIQIGAITLPGLDLAAATAAVNNLLARIQDALGSVLAPLGLSNLLSLRLFDRQTGVTESAGVVKALSSITGLVLKLTPPSLGSLAPLAPPGGGIGTLRSRSAAKVSDESTSRSLTATAANPLDGMLGTVLGGASLLSKGLELRVGTVQSQSLHTVAAAVPVPASPLPAMVATPETGVITGVSTADGTLPRTGRDQTTLALLGLALGAAALGARRLRRQAKA